MEDKKICTKCKAEKELSFFNKDYRRKSIYRSQCKSCESTAAKEREPRYKKTREDYRLNNTEKIATKARKEYIENREKILSKHAEYRETDNSRFHSYKRGARIRNLAFSLTKETFLKFIHGKICYYCGEEHERLGIDRKDSSIGYIIDNCVTCCSMCNRIKNIYNETTFLNKIKQIYEFKNN